MNAAAEAVLAEPLVAVTGVRDDPRLILDGSRGDIEYGDYDYAWVMSVRDGEYSVGRAGRAPAGEDYRTSDARFVAADLLAQTVPDLVYRRRVPRALLYALPDGFSATLLSEDGVELRWADQWLRTHRRSALPQILLVAHLVAASDAEVLASLDSPDGAPVLRSEQEQAAEFARRDIDPAAFATYSDWTTWRRKERNA